MALFSFFKRTASRNPAVFLLSYTFCYQGLPKVLFSNPASVVAALQADGSVALQGYISDFLQEYVKETPAARPHIPEDFSSLFSVEVRQIDSSLSVVLISYPTPPRQPVERSPGVPILAPYFTAIVFNPSTPAKMHCFVLGQRPGGGTTLRSVSGENSDGNCGAGCGPVPEEFLNLVSQVEREGIEAAWKRYPQG